MVDAVGDMHGLPGSPIDGVIFKKCRVTATKGFYIEYAKNMNTSGLEIMGVDGESIIRKNINEP